KRRAIRVWYRVIGSLARSSSRPRPSQEAGIYRRLILSLLIWAIPEGFGGPYGPGSTDIGTGIVYSFVFLSLIIINAMSGTSKYSLDYLIEPRLPSWKRVAEFGQITPR